MDIEEIITCSGVCSMACFCEHGDEPSGSTTAAYFLTSWVTNDFKTLYILATDLVHSQCSDYRDLGISSGLHAEIFRFLEMSLGPTCNSPDRRRAHMGFIAPSCTKWKQILRCSNQKRIAGMWRETPPGLLARVGHRPPCSPAATETTWVHFY
jgi:hypothetical protein